MRKTQSDRESQSDIRLRRDELRNAIPATILLFLALMIAGGDKSPSDMSGTDILWATLFLMGIALLIRSSVVAYLRADELQRMMRLKVASLSFMVTITGLCIATLLGSLQLVSPAIMLQGILIGGLLFWSIAQTVLDKKNRS